MSSINQITSANQVFNPILSCEAMMDSNEAFITHFETIYKAHLTDQLSVAEKTKLHALIRHNYPCNGREISLPQMLFIVALSLENLPAMQEISARAFINLDLADDKGITPLQGACLRNRGDIIDFLVREGADINLADHEKMTPLMNAVENELVEVVRVLVQFRSLDLSRVNREGMNALHMAALADNPTILSILLEVGADPLALTKSRLSTLQLVCQNPNPHFVSRLLNHVSENNGPVVTEIPSNPMPINHHHIQQPATSSHKRSAAAAFAQSESKRYKSAEVALTRLQSLVKYQGPDFENALQIACQNENAQVLRTFLHFVFSNCPELIEVLKKQSASAIQTLIETDNLQIAKILQQYGMNLDPKLLLYFIERHRFPLAQLLTSQHLHLLYEINEEGNTPLIQAINAEGVEQLSNGIDFIRFLTKSSFIHSFEIKDRRGYRALHHAVMENKFLICQILLNAGADLDATTSDAGGEEFTTVHLAAQRENLQILTELLRLKKEKSLNSYQAFIDKKTASSNQSALYMSVSRLHAEACTKVLLDHGATIDEKTFLYAIKSGQIGLVQEFLTRGAVLTKTILEAPEATLNEVLAPASEDSWHQHPMPADFSYFSHPLRLLDYTHAGSLAHICEKQKAISALLKGENHNPTFFDAMLESYKVLPK